MNTLIKLSAIVLALSAFACAGPEFTGGALDEELPAGAGNIGGDAGSGGSGGSASASGASAGSGDTGSVGGSASAGAGGTESEAGAGGEGGVVEPTLCMVPDVTVLPTELDDYSFAVEQDGHCAEATTPVHCTITWGTPELLSATSVRVPIGTIDCGAVTIEHGVCDAAEPFACSIEINNRAWQPDYQFDLEATEAGFTVVQFSEFNTPLPVNDMIVWGEESGNCASGTPGTGPGGYRSDLVTALGRRFVAAMEAHIFPCAQ